MKLSESAKLYFKDYFILSSLHDEIHSYLNEILIQFDNKLKQKYKSDITWVNNSNKGMINIYPNRFFSFDTNRFKIPYIQYRDARLINLEFPNTILLSIETSKDSRAQSTKQELLSMDKTFFDEYKIYINLDNIDATISDLMDNIAIIMKKFGDISEKIEKISN